MSDELELLPCPFCAWHKPNIIEAGSGTNFWFTPGCPWCDFRLSSCGDREVAVAKWNQRKGEQRHTYFFDGSTLQKVGNTALENMTKMCSSNKTVVDPKHAFPEIRPITLDLSPCPKCNKRDGVSTIAKHGRAAIYCVDCVEFVPLHENWLPRAEAIAAWQALPRDQEESK